MRLARLLLLLVWPLSLSLNAQVDVEGTLNKAFKKGDYLTAVSPVAWRPGLNLLVGIAPVGQPLPITVQLSVGTSYTFIGTAATEAAIIDLHLTGLGNGSLIAADTADDATPIIEFTPLRSGAYTLHLTTRAANDSTISLGLALLQRGGVDLPDREYALTAEGFFGGSKALRKATNGLSWAKQAPVWCVLGALPATDQTVRVSLEKIAIPAASYTIAASSLNKQANLNLYLIDEAGKVVADSGLTSAYPLLNYQNSRQGRYDIYLKSEQTRESAFTLLGIYQREL